MNRPGGWLAAALLGHALVFASSAIGQAQQTTFGFFNHTTATVRIEMVPAEGSPVIVHPAIGPKQGARLSLPLGRLVLDVVAFRTQPQRVHRIGVDVREGGEASYHFILHMTGAYILEDADSLAATAILPSAPLLPDARNGDEVVSVPDDTCKNSERSITGAVLWLSQESAQYYRVINPYLCGLEGEDLFVTGPVYAHFICSPGWTDCARHRKGDFRVLPSVRTSDIMDIPLQLARRQDPEARFTETWEIISLDPPVQKASLTTFISSSSNIKKTACPEGYRLHYQGFCINIADELTDDAKAGVRGLDPAK